MIIKRKDPAGDYSGRKKNDPDTEIVSVPLMEKPVIGKDPGERVHHTGGETLEDDPPGGGFGNAHRTTSLENQ